MINAILAAVIGITLVGTGCVVLERLFPALPGIRLLRSGWRTDLVFAFASPLIVRVMRRIAVGLALVPIAVVAGHGLDVTALLSGFGPLARQPLWLQGTEMLLAADFIGYWEHRLFHGRSLWRIHAVHHSSEQLDWLAAFRVHPLNDIATGVLRALPLVALGFQPLVLAGALPFLTLNAIFIHANVPWAYGKLRYVIASPAFHRWHHTAEADGRDRNFAGLFPVWDLLFGTFHMPAHLPARFGIDDTMPPGYFRQLVWPFHRR